MTPAAESSIPKTDFVFREEVPENHSPYILWAAVAPKRTKGQPPFVTSASLDETSARLEYRVWREAFEKEGCARAASDALWSLKFAKSCA